MDPSDSLVQVKSENISNFVNHPIVKEFQVNMSNPRLPTLDLKSLNNSHKDAKTSFNYNKNPSLDRFTSLSVLSDKKQENLIEGSRDQNNKDNELIEKDSKKNNIF